MYIKNKCNIYGLKISGFLWGPLKFILGPAQRFPASALKCIHSRTKFDLMQLLVSKSNTINSNNNNYYSTSVIFNHCAAALLYTSKFLKCAA